jgi:hypothetical protein
MSTKVKGLTCPNCNGIVPVAEGVRVVHCPFCDLRCLVQGERGVRRWQVANRVDSAAALSAVSGFFTGLNKAFDLKKKAHVRELFLVYLPYWRVHAFVAGWMFGRVKSGKDSTRPVEVEVMEEMHWNDAAADVSEFGVHQVAFTATDLEPYESERLHGEGMVFEPSESRTEALAEAEDHFVYTARRKKSLKTRYFEKFHLLRPHLSLVYYPLWVGRYQYRNRSYQVVVDGLRGRVLYGKAPGNIFYRAAALVGGMALGNFVMINGTLVAGWFLDSSSDEDGLGLLCLPFAVGVGLIVAAYRTFRYGEEVEKIDAGARKASGSRNQQARGWLAAGANIIEELTHLSKDKR